MAETGGLDFDRWAEVEGTQLGVNVIDTANRKIGPNIAKRTGVGLNWYPLDRFQHVLIGEIDHYGFFDGVGAEADWNIFIKPSADFAFLLDDALPNADHDEVHRCQRLSGFCMEAEVTPDQSFYDNPFFPKSGPSPLVGHTIGAYGPWVAEEAHGWRPEIHPSQALWWRDRVPGTSGDTTRQEYHLLVVQDDSNRFDRRDDFSGNIVRPWSKPPIDMLFRVAVRVPAGQIRRLVMTEVFGRHVHPIGSSAPDAILDLTPSAAHVAVGRTQVRVHKAPDPTHVDVRFESFTERTARRPPFSRDSEFRGYVSVRVNVGENDRGGEGYVALVIREEIVAQGVFDPTPVSPIG